MSTTVLKFLLSDSVTEVLFYKGEILDTPLIPEIATEIQVLQKQYPTVFTKSDEYDRIDITFRVLDNDTEDKIDQIIEDGGVMTCYYIYRDAPATTLSVILDPLEVVEDFARSGKSYGAQKILTFLQAS